MILLVVGCGDSCGRRTCGGRCCGGCCSGSGGDDSSSGCNSDSAVVVVVVMVVSWEFVCSGNTLPLYLHHVETTQNISV